MKQQGTHYSINTIRSLCDRLYGENKYSLIDDYNRIGRPSSWKKIYSLDDGKNWHYCGDLVGKLTAACKISHK